MIKKSKKYSKTAPKYGQILGINVFSTTTEELLTRVNNYLSYNVTGIHNFYIVTPNPELVLMAQTNPELKKALNSAELPVPDGTGLSWASRFLYKERLNIIHGRHLFYVLCDDLNKRSGRIFLLGGENGEAELAATKLRQKYPKLNVEAFQGPKLSLTGEPASSLDRKLQDAAIKRINDFKPDMIFVAFGNPKQEIWIYKNLKDLKTGGAMAVGGTFRYAAGLSKLPPHFVENLELEWLWRLVTEPRRFGRIFNATVIFPIKVILYKLGSK